MIARTLFALVAVLILASDKALAAAPSAPLSDPCQSSAVVKRSVPISDPAGVAELVAASSKTIHVCGFTATSGGNPFLFEYGSGTACGTGTVNLTGELTNAPVSYSGPGTIFSVPANNALCVTGNNPVTGVLTYTQP
jgi:hypothetical protein